MRSGVCTLSIVPCRKEPSGSSEMVTQLLFGDHYRVLEEKDGWMRIRIAADGYECWVSSRQHTRINDTVFQELEKAPPRYASDLVGVMKNGTTDGFMVTIGSDLAMCNIDGDLSFVYEGQAVEPNNPGTAQAILNTAMAYLRSPYLWGGKTPFGIDCSGFTQMVFRLNGYNLPRDAYQQVEVGQPLSFVEEAEAGDLAFFDNEAGRITHVGILLDKERIIHASGFVRIDKFDHYGIFSPEMRGYSHHLRVIKRILT